MKKYRKKNEKNVSGELSLRHARTLVIENSGPLELKHPDIARWKGYSAEIVATTWTRKAIWVQHKTSQGYAHLLSMDKVKLLSPGDRVHFFYLDPHLPQNQLLPFSKNLCFLDQQSWSVWWKPVGYLTQRNYFGTWGNLEDQVREHTKKEVYVVHRLDRETQGLVVVAHTVQMASRLGDIFQQRKVDKYYLAWVKGLLNEKEDLKEQVIDRKLDGKEALTSWKILGVCHQDPHHQQTLVRLLPHTGRFHQLRRHMDMIGHPIMGDPVYGKGNKNKEGLQLACYRLAIKDLNCDVLHIPDSFMKEILWDGHE